MVMRSSSSHAQAKRSSIQGSLSRKNKRKNGVSIAKLLIASFLFLVVLTLCVSMYAFNNIIEGSNSSGSVAASNTKMKTKNKASVPLPPKIEAEQQGVQKQEEKKDERLSSAAVSTSELSVTLNTIRAQFYNRYGGKDMSEDLYHKAIKSYGSIENTAERILRAAAKKRPFVISFAGYSVTVGRGNFFNQSYPFVMQRVIEDAIKGIGIPSLIVRNSAIGGIPSFPYAFCLKHFLGEDSDVISWDFSMNEGGGASILEAYVRQGLSQLSKQPMMIMLDTKNTRTDLLQKYTKLHILKDAISIGQAKSVVDPKILAKSDTDPSKPIGFRDMEEFGAPKGCPGRSSWHPRKKEHEFMGWMIGMHFLEAIDVANKKKETLGSAWSSVYNSIEKDQQEIPRLSFPANLVPHKGVNDDSSITEILYGHHNLNNENEYTMKDVSCRTNFLPAPSMDDLLPSVIISGTNKETNADNIMDDRTDEMYQNGWVYDVSQTERDTKRKVISCGGLGYIDMKIALYGIPESGTLKLWLPYEISEHHIKENFDKNNDDATTKFDDFIICEANDKRGKDACHLDQDIKFVVGGITVQSNSIQMITGAGEYLKRPTCVNVGIPNGAKTSMFNDIQAAEENTSDLSHSSNDVGMTVEISVSNSNVSRKNGACCISHIVWEMH